MSQNSKDDHSEVPMDIEPETSHAKQSNVTQCESPRTDLINILETSAFFQEIDVSELLATENGNFVFVCSLLTTKYVAVYK